MPNCIAMKKKGMEKNMTMMEVDDDIRNHLGLPAHPTEWALNWYNTVGELLACGKKPDEIVEMYRGYAKSPEESKYAEYWSMKLRLVEYIRDEYVVDAWYSPR